VARIKRTAGASTMTLPQSRRGAGSIATFSCIVLSIVLALTTPSNADLTFLGPSPYLSEADGPFKGLNFDYFYVEDFEDLALNTPGVTRSAGTIGEEARAYRDSVDGDDGTIDGLGTEGESLFIAKSSALWDWLPWLDRGFTGITFTFNRDVLGAFPTHVGIVWTDAEGPPSTSVFLEPFGPTGISLGTFGPHSVGDSTTSGTTGDDRFLGVIDLNGISAVRIFQHADQMEVDHLQYGHVKAGALDQDEDVN
jgi:hypothetical protein